MRDRQHFPSPVESFPGAAEHWLPPKRRPQRQRLHLSGCCRTPNTPLHLHGARSVDTSTTNCRLTSWPDSCSILQVEACLPPLRCRHIRYRLKIPDADANKENRCHKNEQLLPCCEQKTDTLHSKRHAFKASLTHTVQLDWHSGI